MSITFRSLGWARVCAIVFTLSAVPILAVAAETVTYEYDELGRLTAVDRSGTVNNGAQSAYALDAAGNRAGVVQSVGATGGGTDTGSAVAELCSLALPEAVKAQLNCP